MSDVAPCDQADFRKALGMFATGVTIVTTRAADGTPIGLTANSFNAVSLEPRLVLWSLAKSARSLAAFRSAAFWNVHVLSADQEKLSNRFARSGEDKFADVALDTGVTDAPLLRGCSARFQCRTFFVYEGGDHVIFLGEVIRYDRDSAPPLLYLTGRYALAIPLAANISSEGATAFEHALFDENLLGYLLGRAHLLYMNGFRRELLRQGLGDADFFVLSLLGLRQPLPPEEIVAHLSFTGSDFGEQTLTRLRERGFLVEHAKGAGLYGLSTQGETAIMRVMVACKAVESDLVEQIGAHEARSLRHLLKRVIHASDPGLPKVWVRQ